MKITSYTVQAQTIAYEETRRGTHLVLQLCTDDGLEGIGFTTLLTSGGWLIAPLKATIEGLCDTLVGQDPRQIESLTHSLRARGVGPLAGWTNRAVSVIDVALWDIRAKVQGLPLWRLLGGSRNEVPVYASYRLWAQNDLPTLQANAAGFVAEGFTAMKYRLGGVDTIEDAVARTRAIREAVGPSVQLMVDVNQGWSLKQALSIAPALEEFNLFWLEDPISCEDEDGLGEIARQIKIPLTVGENYHSAAPFRRLLAHGAVDIVMVDLDVGGLTPWLKVAHLAEAYERPVVSHLATEVLAHALAAMPNGIQVEYNPWAQPLWREPMQLRNGNLVLPERPGLGLELKEEYRAG